MPGCSLGATRSKKPYFLSLSKMRFLPHILGSADMCMRLHTRTRSQALGVRGTRTVRKEAAGSRAHTIGVIGSTRNGERFFLLSRVLGTSFSAEDHE